MPQFPSRLLLAAALAATMAAPAAAASAAPFETRALAGSHAALYAMRDDRLPTKAADTRKSHGSSR